METIVWVSRHPLNSENIRILQEAFGEFKVYQLSKTIRKEEIPEIIDYYGKNAKYVVVLPPDLLNGFLQQGVEVYRFIVERTVTEDGGVVVRPVGLERILEIKYVTERIV